MSVWGHQVRHPLAAGQEGWEKGGKELPPASVIPSPGQRLQGPTERSVHPGRTCPAEVDGQAMGTCCSHSEVVPHPALRSIPSKPELLVLRWAQLRAGCRLQRSLCASCSQLPLDH